MKAEEWTTIDNINDTQEGFTLLYQKIMENYDKSFPKGSVRSRYKTKLLWVNKQLKDRIKKKEPTL